MVALLSLLFTLAPADTTLDAALGSWVRLTPRTEAFAPDPEVGPDSIRIRTYVERLEITSGALVSTVVYETQPPHGSGELEAIQLRDPYRADGLTLTVQETPGDSARLVVAPSADTLVISRPDQPDAPATTYHRAPDASFPEAFVGLWIGRTSVVDVGIAFDVELGMRVGADGSVAFESGGEVQDVGVGSGAVALGRYLLLPDDQTTYHGAPGGTEMSFYSLAELSDGGERLSWTDSSGARWALRRAPETTDG